MTSTSPAATAPAPGRSISTEDAVKFAVLLAYTLLLAVVLPEHEPWTDEAQSWLLARDASIWNLLTERLRYEGTPALWTLLLSVPAKLGLPYESMQVLGALAALGAVTLLVFKAPFPLWLRALLPFTYFLGYQYALVARNYCLLALVLFAIASVARTRRAHYWPFAVGVLLLSHITLHATLFAGAIWLVEVARTLQRARREGVAAVRSPLLGLGVLAINFVLILAQLWPAADLLLRPPFNDLNLTLDIIAIVTQEAFGQPLLLGLLLLVLLLPALWRGAALPVFLLGNGFVYALISLRYFSYWHIGTVFVFTVFCAWLAWDEFAQIPEPDRRRAWPKWLGLGALTGICLLQIPSMLTVAWNDYQLPYSSSRAAAAYLQQRQIDRRVIHGFDVHSVAVLPYFTQNIFANFRNSRGASSYWIWNQAALQGMRREAVLQGRPEFVLVTGKRTGQFLGDLTQFGYVLERRFPGSILWRWDRLESDELLLYRRSDLEQ